MGSYFIKYQIYIVAILSLFAYVILGYFFEREQFYLLFSLYASLFVGMLVLIKGCENEKIVFKVGLVFRFVFLIATPSLSQDFYRFIWDGQAILAGINPYLHQPETIINTIATFPNADYLYAKMGALSASNFSNYPPVNQLLFVISAFIGGKSILASTIVLRMIIILADIGIYHFGKKILLHLKMDTKNIYWYFLNPLVILELTGNLHFEGVMLFFFILGMYYLIKNKCVLAAIFIALSISVKLLPLLLLPLFFNFLGFKKSILFYSLIIGLNLLFFLPFLNEALLDNYMATISLWFVNFEFNASLYYVLREIGYYCTGYNIIQTIGKITPFVTIGIVLYFAFLKQNKTIEAIVVHSLLIVSLYFFISTTIHPWYCINLVALSVFTKYKFPIIWSFLIVLSYYAYSIHPFKENMLLITVEYAIVFIIFFYEIIQFHRIKNA